MRDDAAYHGRGSNPVDQPSGAEPEPKNRTTAQRDRDRVLYSSAFRRLAGITQVATPETGHQFHNRLTHTLKVEQVAVRLAQRLIKEGLDPQLVDVDVVSTAALAHDLGHPPFGHIAEHVLNTAARDCGGFEGNAQSFRIVTKLAVNKPEQWGLGLTSRSLNGILKYPWLRGEHERYPDKWGAYESERDEFLRARHGHPAFQRSLEAEIMDWADDVTFAVHDLEDFFRAGIIPLDQIATSKREQARFRASFFNGNDEAQGLHQRYARDGVTVEAIDEAFAVLFDDVFAETDPFLGSREDRSRLRRRTSFLISTYDCGATVSERSGGGMALDIPLPLRAQVAVLKGLTWHYVIGRPSLAVIQEGQQTIVRELFKRFTAATASEDQRAIFPALERDLLERTSNEEEQVRVVIDLIAGLTEPMAVELHHRLTGVSRGSILDSAARAL
jgi:dGTPase